ncbi:MAG: hypothetical protein FJ026_09760 [Chloroflexi bacterium]|nr:hypothetical protein [Chloroflexota bacterium]
MITVNFYTRHAFPGWWRQVAWLPVQWLTGKYVHCDIDWQGQRWTSDMQRGVVMHPHELTPDMRYSFHCDDDAVAAALSQMRSLRYDWRAFWTVWLPRRWQMDGRGLICSEHAALALMRGTGAHASRWVWPLALAIYAADPSRLTPTALHDLCRRSIDWLASQAGPAGPAGEGDL